MVIRVSDKKKNYSKVTKLLVKPNDNDIDYITSILPSLQYYPSIYKFTDGKFTNELDLSEWNDLEERLINWLDKNKIN